MQRYFAALTIVLLLGIVLSRALPMKLKGAIAIYFGKIDRKDFLILPFALFYFFAAAFNLPTVSKQEFFHSGIVSCIGVFFCLAGLILLLLSLVSFRTSFRVGIAMDHPKKLVTTGVFAISRNPVYVTFGFAMFGEFLEFPNWILLVNMVVLNGLSTVKYCAKTNT